MRDNIFSVIRQYRIWICLLAKRMLRQPVYIGLLALIPVIGYAVGVMERDERGGVVAAVCVEDGAWRDEIVTSLSEQEEDSVIRFEFCDDRSLAERMVAGGEADCGFAIPADIEERVLGGDWRKAIEVYETSASSITGMAKERIAGVIFRLYSEENYAEYMGQISESAIDFAMDAYHTHLTDDSTFEFRYIYDDQNSQFVSDSDDGNDNNVNNAVFPIRGVFAVLIFIAGMCGMLEYESDKREKRFLRIAPNILTYLVNIWLSTVFVSIAVLLCLWIFDGIHSCGESLSLNRVLTTWSASVWLKQIAGLILYQCAVVGYCVILRPVLRRQETIAVAIPLLAMGSLICSPVFIRLGAYLPVFAVLEKLFPVSYYLMWFT